MGPVLCLGLMSLGACTPKGDHVLLREMRDRIEIEQLLWRYARTLDSGDAEGYAAVFAPDGQFGAGGNATKGTEALRQMIHDADHATVHSYWITMFPGAGAETPARVAAVGRGADQLVRLDGHWLIQVRNVTPQD